VEPLRNEIREKCRDRAVRSKRDKLLMRVGIAREKLMTIVFVRKASSNLLFVKTQSLVKRCMKRVQLEDSFFG